EACVYQVNRVRRFWVRVNFAEIPGTLTKSAVVIYSRPMLASVIGAVEAAVLRLDDGINAIGISSRSRDADPAENSIGKTIPLQAFPCYAVVFRSIQSATGTATGKEPWLSRRLQKRRKHDVGVMRIENDVDTACVFIFR